MRELYLRGWNLDDRVSDKSWKDFIKTGKEKGWIFNNIIFESNICRFKNFNSSGTLFKLG